MIFHDFSRALGQISDPRFRRVLFLGVLLSLALLVAIYAAFLWAIQTFTPDTIDIPFVGPVGGLNTLLSWGSAALMVGLSVFLMIPVASAFCGLFLEDVAGAVEDRHYPGLPPVKPTGMAETLISSANFLGLMIAVNIVALLFYTFTGPFAPLVFWAFNGLLLGREFFTLVAMRRLGKQGAKALRKQHRLQIWFAGVLMAAPLSIPLVNLFIPVLGVATFTHLFHRLTANPALR
jgi:CysZ protein